VALPSLKPQGQKVHKRPPRKYSCFSSPRRRRPLLPKERCLRVVPLRSASLNAVTCISLETLPMSLLCLGTPVLTGGLRVIPLRMASLNAVVGRKRWNEKGLNMPLASTRSSDVQALPWDSSSYWGAAGHSSADGQSQRSRHDRTLKLKPARPSEQP